MKKTLFAFISIIGILSLKNPAMAGGKEGGGGNKAGLKNFTNHLASIEQTESRRALYKKDFCSRALQGFKDLKEILETEQIANPIFPSREAELIKLIDSVCSADSKLFDFLSDQEKSQVESGDLLIAKNFPKTGEIKINEKEWDARKKELEDKWLLKTIAVHEFLSLKPFSYEETNVYTWSRYVWQNKYKLENKRRLPLLSEYADKMSKNLNAYETLLSIKFPTRNKNDQDNFESVFSHRLGLSYGSCLMLSHEESTILLKHSQITLQAEIDHLPICDVEGVSASYRIKKGRIGSSNPLFPTTEKIEIAQNLFSRISLGNLNDKIIVCDHDLYTITKDINLESTKSQPTHQFCLEKNDNY